MIGGMLMMLVLFILSEGVTSELIGNHVCLKEHKYKQMVPKYVLRNITVRSYQWCVQVPPRCSVYTTQQINETIQEEKDGVRYINVCCEGYYEVDSKCLPNSCRSCDQGECGEDGRCRCRDGYWGDNCDKECTEGDWSVNCRNICERRCAEGHCDIGTGNCTCPPKPIRCDLICSEGREGECYYEHCKCDRFPTVRRDYVKRLHDLPESNLTRTDVSLGTNHGNFDVTTSRETDSPIVTTSPEESFKGRDTIIADWYDIMKVTTNTEKMREKEDYYTTKAETESNINTVEITTQAHSAKQSLTTKIINSNKQGIESSHNETHFGNLIPLNNKQEMQSRNESSHKVIIDGHLFITIISGALFSVLIIMSAAVVCVLYKLKEKKKKYVNTNNDDENTKIKDSVSSVSITTRSIFHTPLPDPPIFENPTFLTQFEGTQTKQPGTFETHVICNMNIPKLTTSYNQTKPAEHTELFYDHPPSTGSYRAASILEPPKSPNSGYVKSNAFDPIYDEIPCNKRVVAVVTPPPSYASEQSTLYMNTT